MPLTPARVLTSRAGRALPRSSVSEHEGGTTCVFLPAGHGGVVQVFGARARGDHAELGEQRGGRAAEPGAFLRWLPLSLRPHHVASRSLM